MKNKTFCFLACATLMVVACTTVLSGAAENYISNVHFSSKMAGKVGDHFETNITYEIGWTRTGSGTVVVSRSAVNNPEYEIFANSLPAGLVFHTDTGVLEGTPQEAGVWHLTPAVRTGSMARSHTGAMDTGSRHTQPTRERLGSKRRNP